LIASSTAFLVAASTLDGEISARFSKASLMMFSKSDIHVSNGLVRKFKQAGVNNNY